MRILHLVEVDSTNAYIMRNIGELEAPVMVVAHTQTAGQGQRGNSWEAEPGKNLTFSIFFRPVELLPMAQFAMSEAVALAVVDFLAGHGIEAKVKWPNDIYVDDRKICGILIRHSVMGGYVSYSVIGVGIDVNQTLFLSDAPNPVSMKQITGKTYDLKLLEKEIAEIMEGRLKLIRTEEERLALHKEFFGKLWRGDGRLHPFADTATGENFMASIEDIAFHGPMTLRLSDGSLRTYAFKEVSFLMIND
ncbi:MAG: biotin--[acetyl-CoA-carboxylase] ligase [Muribaculaceae bacterium]|nr:biotin--[acetyl-CoA-carboxylase] ligase [Muribaculaceae bacterium]MDE6480902.1 biotin--[acetyl-CoA-carboxylase] ligase [Muribaculaceae bacterium]